MRNAEVRVMSHCPNCYRTFFQDKLDAHIKSCKPNNVQRLNQNPARSFQNIVNKDLKSIEPSKSKQSPTLSPIPIEKFKVRPKAIMCHICGREFGTASIEIHIKQCEKLWDEREQLKTPNQRRPVPQASVDIPITKSFKNIDAHNEKVYEVFKQNVMVKCPNCFRNFLDDRIQVHLKSCTSEKPHKMVSSIVKQSEGQEVEKGNEVANQIFNNKVMIECPNCSRNFLQDLIDAHLKNCAKEKSPQKPQPDQAKTPTIKKYKSSDKPPDPLNKSENIKDNLLKTFSKPKSVMCHICGREFGTASIEIHIKQCENLWVEKEKSKPPNQRRPVPQAPDSIPVSKTTKNLAMHNEKVSEAFTQNVMQRCPNCFRTFLEDRIEIHLKSCTSENPHKIASSIVKSSEGQDVKTFVQKSNLKVYESPDIKEEKMISRPKSVMCHICGREFGTASIGIHIKNCAKLWEEKESKKPKNERRPIPAAPVDLPLGTSFKDLEKRNIMVSEAFTNNVMVQCQNCLRTFLEDRIEVHLRSCTSENPHKTVTGATRNPEMRQHAAKPPSEEKKSPQSPSPDTKIMPKTLMCHICGREFGTTSIEIHQKSCAKLWEERESKKPESQRRPVPQAAGPVPSSKSPSAIKAHNDLVSVQYNTSTLLPCPNCKRTFNEESLQIHQRSCKKQNPSKPMRKA